MNEMMERVIPFPNIKMRDAFSLLPETRTELMGVCQSLVLT